MDGNGSHLAVRAGKRLVDDDVLRTRTNYQSVRMDLDKYLRSRWNDGRIAFGELWNYYARYPYLARLRDRRVLESAVLEVLGNMDVSWPQKGFALATGYDTAHGNFVGLAVPTEDHEFGQVDDATLLVAPHLAQAQRDREQDRERETQPSGTTSPAGTGPDGTGVTGRATPKPPPPEPPAVTPNARYEARVSIDAAGDLASQLATVANEVLVHLQRQDPEALDITVQVSAERLDGFPDSTVRTVSENANTLRFAQSKFEDGQ